MVSYDRHQQLTLSRQEIKVATVERACEGRVVCVLQNQTPLQKATEKIKLS